MLHTLGATVSVGQVRTRVLKHFAISSPHSSLENWGHSEVQPLSRASWMTAQAGREHAKKLDLDDRLNC